MGCAKRTQPFIIRAVAIFIFFDNYRVFRWLGPFSTHDWDLWNRTSGKKCAFWEAFGAGPLAEKRRQIPGEMLKPMCLGKCPFSDLFWVHGWPYHAQCFLIFEFPHAVFIMFSASKIIQFLFPFSVCVITNTTPTHQHTNTPTHQHTNTPTHNTQHTAHNRHNTQPQTAHNTHSTAQHSTALPATSNFRCVLDDS